MYKCRMAQETVLLTTFSTAAHCYQRQRPADAYQPPPDSCWDTRMQLTRQRCCALGRPPAHAQLRLLGTASQIRAGCIGMSHMLFCRSPRRPAYTSCWPRDLADSMINTSCCLSWANAHLVLLTHHCLTHSLFTGAIQTPTSVSSPLCSSSLSKSSTADAFSFSWPTQNASGRASMAPVNGG